MQLTKKAASAAFFLEITQVATYAILISVS